MLEDELYSEYTSVYNVTLGQVVVKMRVTPGGEYIARPILLTVRPFPNFAYSPVIISKDQVIAIVDDAEYTIRRGD